MQHATESGHLLVPLVPITKAAAYTAALEARVAAEKSRADSAEARAREAELRLERLLDEVRVVREERGFTVSVVAMDGSQYWSGKCLPDDGVKRVLQEGGVPAQATLVRQTSVLAVDDKASFRSVGITEDTVITAVITRNKQTFAVGDIVEYWSESFSQWMNARVTADCAGEDKCHLDVKRNAKLSRVRRCDGA
eukprot:TRINITY_DN39769_c0_g1_i1.p1 TRINITY_DN39769_c0_g1~~TRINITY_DN39769_c0_g1_i1.p1  ORF type:complete len:194 (-),score=29.00 TRINITY_DN39769_c0_g1_i1:185-766(-)